MTLYDYIKKILKKINVRDLIFIAVIIVLCMFMIRSCRSQQQANEIYNTNVKALTDTISFYQTKNGELVAQKTAFICEVDELKQLNIDLYNEISDLNTKVNKLQAAANVKGEIVYVPGDTVYLVKSDTISNGFIKDFDFSNQWRTLNGEIIYNNDSLRLDFCEDIVKFDYTLAIDKDNVIHVKSDNPYVQFNDISGFTVPKPRPKRWGLSVYAGFGVNLGYNPFQQKTQMTLGPSVGFAVTYDLIQW